MSFPQQASTKKSEAIWFCAMMLACGFFAVVPMRAPQPKSGTVTTTVAPRSHMESDGSLTASLASASVLALD